MLFLQDGDPTQNSRKPKKAFDDVGCRMFSIPARSPDINPIENMFNNVHKILREDAIEHHIEHDRTNILTSKAFLTNNSDEREAMDIGITTKKLLS